MGKGRKATPPAVRLMQGSRSRWLPKPGEQAIVCPGVPDAPDHLAGLALAHWQMWATHLGRAKLLELIDSGALEKACDAYAFSVEAKKLIDQEGLIRVDPKTGTERKHPAFTIWREASDVYRHFALEFGGTPCSRAKLKMPTPNTETDEFESFVKHKQA